MNTDYLCFTLTCDIINALKNNNDNNKRSYQCENSKDVRGQSNGPVDEKSDS